MRIPLSSPDLNDDDKNAVLDVLNSRTLSLGPKLLEFEKAAADIAGTRHAIAVNSGTSGLHLCVRAAGISPGDEVITSPFSFVASSNCILFERATPVFVDIDPVTYNIIPESIEAAITPRTKALLPVHIFGRPCEIEPILQIANKHGLPVIEDSCEAIGARYFGKPVGSFGQSGVFAFYPNKQVTTGEGGVIVTDDDAVARQCRSLRNQGRAASNWLEHDLIGYNYRLSDVNCALGVNQLRRVDEILAARSRVARTYNQALQCIPEVTPPGVDHPNSEISWFVYVVRLADEFTAADRDRVLLELQRQGVECRNYFPPIHLQAVYRNLFGYKDGAFPVTEHVAARTVALPFFNRLSEDQIEYVTTALRNAIDSLKPKQYVPSGVSESRARSTL